MEDTIQKLFYDKVRRAAIDGLQLLRNWESEGKFILRYPSFPEIRILETGLPVFSELQGLSKQTPVDYTYPYTAISGTRVEPPVSWDDLWRFVCNQPRLRTFFDVDRFAKTIVFEGKSYSQFAFELKLRQIIDHYIHSTGLRYYRKKDFLPVFLDWANAIIPEELQVEFVVPIILLDFDIDTSTVLSKGVIIERMTDEFQLARVPKKSFSVSANHEVLGIATHSLSLGIWTLPNKSLWERNMIPGNIDALTPIIPHLDRFFGALRVVTGYDTGFGQVITRPVGWCDRWTANLKDVYDARLRVYPDWFERDWRSMDRPLVTQGQLEEIGKVLSSLSSEKSNRIAIATRRLNSAYLKRNNEDAVIDICIGLEALLVGEDQGEITHKLASRLSALWHVEPIDEWTSYEVFRAVKDLYKYRSAVVHGSKSTEKKRIIRTRKGKEIGAVNLGLRLLRHSLSICSSHADLLEEGILDKLLVEGHLKELNAS